MAASVNTGYQYVKDAIDALLKANGVGLITGSLLNDVATLILEEATREGKVTKGDTGETGPQGPPGPAGQDGIDGSKFYIENNAPDSSIGIQGDVYLHVKNSSEAEIFFKATDAVWESKHRFLSGSTSTGGGIEVYDATKSEDYAQGDQVRVLDAGKWLMFVRTNLEIGQTVADPLDDADGDYWTPMGSSDATDLSNYYTKTEVDSSQNAQDALIAAAETDISLLELRMDTEEKISERLDTKQSTSKEIFFTQNKVHIGDYTAPITVAPGDNLTYNFTDAVPYTLIHIWVVPTGIIDLPNGEKLGEEVEGELNHLQIQYMGTDNSATPQHVCRVWINSGWQTV